MKQYRKYARKRKPTEENLHAQICDYLKLAYPKVIFNTDMSGVRLTMGQAVKAQKLRSSNGFPDLMILEPNMTYNYSGLFIELKKETPYKLDGGLKALTKTETINGFKVKYNHYQRQADMHNELRHRGYKACFSWSFEQTKDIIDRYLRIS